MRNHFKINIQDKKQKFFRSLNAIFSQIGSTTSPEVILFLVESCSVPVLLYGLESVALTKSLANSIENAYTQAYRKIFRTFDNNVIKQCQFNFGYLTMELKLANRRLRFFSKLRSMCYLNCSMFLNSTSNDDNEFRSLITKYNIDLGLEINKVNPKSLANLNWKWHLIRYFEKQFE